MTIVFEPYTVNDGVFSARLPAQASFTNVSGFVRGKLELIGALEGSQSNDGRFQSAWPIHAELFQASPGIVRAELPFHVSWSSNSLTPSLAVFNTSLPDLTGHFEGSQINDGTVTGALLLRSLMSDAAALVRAKLPLTTYFSDGHIASDRIAFLIQQPSMQASMVPGITVSLMDRMAAQDGASADFILAILELIRISDRYSRLAEILQQVHEGLSLAAVAQMIWQADLLDSFVASAVQAGTAQITVMLRDSFAMDDSQSALSEILAAIRDGFYVQLTIATGDDGYTAWVMTPETRAMRSYSNFPFNSYAELSGQFLGACATGIYRMGGPTDNGAAILAQIRTGLVNFGQENMHTVSRAYIGATTGGNLLLRVQASTYTGAQLEQTYRMIPANTTDDRHHRVDIGKGFRSVYWTFELANDADGTDFEVTDWHVLPVTLPGKLI